MEWKLLDINIILCRMISLSRLKENYSANADFVLISPTSEFSLGHYHCALTTCAIHPQRWQISDILLQFSRENFYLGVCFGRSKTDVWLVEFGSAEPQGKARCR